MVVEQLVEIGRRAESTKHTGGKCITGGCRIYNINLRRLQGATMRASKIAHRIRAISNNQQPGLGTEARIDEPTLITVREKIYLFFRTFDEARKTCGAFAARAIDASIGPQRGAQIDIEADWAIRRSRLAQERTQ